MLSIQHRLINDKKISYRNVELGRSFLQGMDVPLPFSQVDNLDILKGSISLFRFFNIRREIN